MHFIFKYIRFVALIILQYVFLINVNAQTTLNPGNAANDASNGGAGTWTNVPSGALNVDGTYATMTISGTYVPSAYLKTTSYGFAIPTGDVIDGIEITVHWYVSNTGVSENQVRLVKNNLVSGLNKATGLDIPLTTNNSKTFGGPTDLWGETWTPADINNSNFGAAIATQRLSGGGGRTISVNCIVISVYHHTPVPFTYNNCLVFHPTTGSTIPSAKNVRILGLKVVTPGDINPFNLTKITLSTNGGNSTGSDNALNDISNLKVFYTGTSSTYSNFQQYGSTVNSPNGTIEVIGTQQMLADTNFFWITYDLTPGAIVNNRLDAQCLQLDFDGGIGVKVPSITNPTGFRTIANPTVFTIGSSGRNYTTLQAAYNAIPSNPSGVYVLELYNNYNSASEIFPISFNNKLNQTEIIVRPASGQSNIIIQGSIDGQGVINIDGGQNIIMDGYAGGVGPTKQLLIRNTKNASPYGVSVLIRNDAQSVYIRNLNLEAETVGGNGIDGLISIGTTSATRGNDNILIDNCFFNDLTVGGGTIVPYAAVYSGGTASKTNDFIRIENCVSPIFAPAINVLSNTNYVTIENNHFYLPSSFIAGTGNFQFINIVGGTSHSVIGNFLGGTTLGAGGAIANMSGSGLFSAINVSASGNNVIQNNKISNINYETTYSGALQPMVFIRIASDGNYTIIDNIIGSINGTDSLILTHNGTGGAGITCIYETSSGNTEILNNVIGAVTQTGTFAASVFGFADLNNGINHIENNLFGNSTSNNIKINTNSELVGIYGNSSSGLTFENNIIQNIWHNNTGSRGMKILNNNSGILTCKNNLISNVIFNGQLETRIISHIASAYPCYIKHNIIKNITINNASSIAPFSGIYVNNTVASFVDTNKVGDKSVNNITLKQNGTSYGINLAGTSSIYTSGNTVQQFNLSNTGSANCFKGIVVQGGLLYSSYDTVSNINYAGSYTADGILGFEIDLGASDGSEIKKAYITNIKGINNTAADVGIDGIDIYAATTVEDSFISGLENKATGANAAITGLYTEAAANFYNNVVLLSNNTSTNTVDIFGLETNHSAGDVNMYHNTVKIFGSQAGGSLGSYGFFRWTSANTDLRNNILQNIRLGGTYGHYAVFMNNTAGTYVDDYNFIETENALTAAYWGGDQDFSAYQSLAGASNSINNVINIDDNGFTSGVIENAGVDLTSIVSKDRLNNVRSATPWLGAYEIAGIITRYWIGSSGNWNDVSHWSTSSGGASGASVPTAINDVFFDSNSHATGSFIVNMPAGTWPCKNIYFNDVAKSPQIVGTGELVSKP